MILASSRKYCLILLFSLCTPLASAEPGDYTPWETFLNLFTPPEADNPLTDNDQNQPYPLIKNPEDGFEPNKYLAWQTIELDPGTGALCGNGSPYKFFVNRVAHTSNTIIYLEGGGACWDYESCSGQTGIRGARNPNGIPDDYMSLMNPSASLVSPFVFRLHPWTRTKVQGWNMIYVPYCTGDIYIGDKLSIYEDETGQNEDLVWHHNGLKNMRAVTAWIRENLQKPAQMLLTGCSAGGVGSLSNYAGIRQDLAPEKGFLINDSGPIFQAPDGASDDQYPSMRLIEKIRQAWGLDTGPTAFLESLLPGFNRSNMGSISGALANQYQNDRMGHTHFFQDLNYSSYSYERFYDEIENEPDQNKREQMISEKWYQDTEQLMQDLSNYPNFGYYIPNYRAFNESHCSTIVEFANGDIQERNLELDQFIENILEGQGPIMEEKENDWQVDYEKPFNLLYALLNDIL